MKTENLFIWASQVEPCSFQLLCLKSTFHLKTTNCLVNGYKINFTFWSLQGWSHWYHAKALEISGCFGGLRLKSKGRPPTRKSATSAGDTASSWRRQCGPLYHNPFGFIDINLNSWLCQLMALFCCVSHRDVFCGHYMNVTQAKWSRPLARFMQEHHRVFCVNSISSNLLFYFILSTTYKFLLFNSWTLIFVTLVYPIPNTSSFFQAPFRYLFLHHNCHWR